MVDLGTVLMFLALLGEQAGGGSGRGNGNGGGPPGPGPAPGPSPSPTPGPSPRPPPMPPVPRGLPPFPGPGWTPCATTPDIVSRAEYWNPILWNYATRTMVKPYQQEMLGGRWVTFAAARHTDSQGGQLMATEAWCLRAGPGPSPQPSPGPAPTGKPGPVQPYPGAGAYASNAPYIKRYQASLSYMSFTMHKPAWNTQGVDGKFGPHTSAAVSAFQRDNGLQVDGKAGQQTAAMIDQQMGYGGPPIPPPPAPAGGGDDGGVAAHDQRLPGDPGASQGGYGGNRAG